MLVPDRVRKAVCFLYYEGADGVRPAGTAFFYVEPAYRPDLRWMSLVTARHVIDQVRDKSVDGLVRVRLNLKAGGVGFEPVHVDRWVTDPDALVDDVAMAAFPARDDLVDRMAIPSDLLATPDVIADQVIGLGDEVFITGLFVNHYGQNRNIPIVRIGNIAAMPEEPVSTALGPMDAYLIEARSIGGLSGSPVFVNVGWDRSEEAQESILLAGSARSSHIFLLGILHGHWDVTIPAEDAVVSDTVLEGRINMGIAIVIPAVRLLEVVKLPTIAEARALGERHALEGEASTE